MRVAFKAGVLLFSLCCAVGSLSAENELGKAEKGYNLELAGATYVDSCQSWFMPIVINLEFKTELPDKNEQGRRMLPLDISVAWEGGERKTVIYLAAERLERQRFEEFLVMTELPLQQHPADRQDVDGVACKVKYNDKEVSCKVKRSRKLSKIDKEEIEFASGIQAILAGGLKRPNFLRPIATQYEKEITGTKIDMFLKKYDNVLDDTDKAAIRLAKLFVEMPRIFQQFGHGRNQTEAENSVEMESLIKTAEELQACGHEIFECYGLFVKGFLEGMRSRWVESESALKKFNAKDRLSFMRGLTKKMLVEIERKKGK